MSQPNLICICLDTFRTDLLEGKLDFVETPNLDRLKEESVNFTSCFGECQPTLQMRRSVFTGRRSFPWNYNFDRRGHWHHAAGWHKIPPHQDTMAEILTKYGYATGLIADTYHMFKSTMNYKRGFLTYDFIRGQESDNWKGGTREMIKDRMKEIVREPIDWDRHSVLCQYLYNNQDRKSEEDYSPARVFNRSREWIENNYKNSPFFLWIDSFDPHEPWDPPQKYADKYKPDYEGKDFIIPGTAWQQVDEPSAAEIKRIKALYYGEATFVDKCIGKLFDKLDTLNLWQDSIVVLLSDHGTQVMDHGNFGKGANNLRAYNTKINFRVNHPDIAQKTDIEALVQAHDVFPTLLGLLEIPVTSEGEDAWSLVTGDRDKIREEAVIGWAGWAEGKAIGRASVRSQNWNYTASLGGDNLEKERLFDLRNDSEENVDVYKDYPEIIKVKRKQLEKAINQPLPGTFNEVCDSCPPPRVVYDRARKEQKQC